MIKLVLNKCCIDVLWSLILQIITKSLNQKINVISSIRWLKNNWQLSKLFFFTYSLRFVHHDAEYWCIKFESNLIINHFMKNLCELCFWPLFILLSEIPFPLCIFGPFTIFFLHRCLWQTSGIRNTILWKKMTLLLLVNDFVMPIPYGARVGSIFHPLRRYATYNIDNV